MVLLAAFYRPLLRAVVAGALDIATGDRFAFEVLQLRADRLSVRGLHVRRAGEPLLDVARLDLAYDPRELLPGSAHRFGLHRVAVDDARLWIVRRRDGSFTVASASAGTPPNPARGPSQAAPLAFDLQLSRGSIVVLDPWRKIAASRRLSLDALRLDARVDTVGRSVYRARALVAGDPESALSLAGTVDAARGFAMHRLTARRVPLVAMLNYLINSPKAQVRSGELRDLDVRAYALGAGEAYHLSGGAALVGGAMRIPGLVPAAQDMRGRLNVFDDGVAARSLDATIGGARVRLAGALYGWRDPAFRRGVTARLSLPTARRLFAFSRRLPVSGPVLTVRTLVEGAVGSPLVDVTLAGPQAAYGSVPLAALRGNVAYYASSVTLVQASAGYGAVDVDARGTLDIAEHDTPQLVVEARAPAGALPFVAQAAPTLATRAVALLTGTDLALDARGVVSGSAPGVVLGTLFRIDRTGDGEFGPLHLQTAGGGDLAAAYYFDRSASQSGFWLDVNGLTASEVAANPRLPALEWLRPPPFAGLVGGSLAGGGTPANFRLAGRLAVHDLRFGSIVLAAAQGQVAGALRDLRLGELRADGPWGAFSGKGAYAGGRLTLAGGYRGSFERLASLTGDLRAHGPVDGPVVLAIDGQRTLVQTSGATTSGAAVRGVPVTRLAGTLGVAGGELDVYAGQARVAGGDLAFAGRVGRGSNERLGLSLAGADARLLRGAGSPLGAGTVSVLGSFGYRGAASRFDGGVAVGSGRYAAMPVAGNGDVHLLGSGVGFDRTLALLGESAGAVSGRVSGLGSGQVGLDLQLSLRDVGLSALLASAARSDADLTGTLDGDLHLGGRSSRPTVRGRVELPEGSYDGQRFERFAADVSAGPTGLSADRGSLVVGSTGARFAGSVVGDDASFRIDAPAADLADFDDLFDAGEALAGRGHMRASFERRGRAIATRADIAFAALRYRNFALGDATARWQSSGSRVQGAVAFGGASGRLQGAGSLVFDGTSPLRSLLARSRFDGTVQLAGLDLAAWLPVVGIEYPLAGRVDADATVDGPVRSPAIKTTATLRDGRIGNLPVDLLTLTAASDRQRTRVTSAELDLAGLTATGTGTFGLGATDPIAFALHGSTPNVGTLAARLFPSAPPLSGAADVDVKVNGTRSQPHLAGGFDLEAATVRGLAVRQLLGQFSLHGHDVAISGAEAAFTKGTVYLAGSVPLTVSPFGLGPASAPLDLDVAVRGVDLSDFAPLLPGGSRLEGALDGHLVLRGTAGSPQLVGRLALQKGLYAPGFEAVPLTNLNAEVAFLGNQATLESLRAEAGGGTLEAHGHIRFADLVRPGADAEYQLVSTASHLYFDLPAFGRGQVDGKIELSHQPGKAPMLAGEATLADATIPFSAFLFPASNDPARGAAGSTATPDPARNVAFNLRLIADRNVRVRSANIDIGGRGALTVAGTLADPVLSGQFDSTGGTLTYFNTVFRLQRGSVVFTPSDGIIPNLDVQATTHVVNPDPNLTRNLTGSADIDLAMAGPVTNLNIQLSSNPAYDREQILGLLFNAPAVGATNLFGGTTLMPGQLSQPALPPGVAVTRPGTGEITVGQEAFGLVNAQFTRTLLAPVESQIGEALGLTNLAVNVDYTGDVGVTARKLLGKAVDAIYGQSFSYPYRQTFGFEVKPSQAMAAQLTYFQTLGVQTLGAQNPLLFGAANQHLYVQPLGGQSGFSFSVQRLFP